MQEPFVSIVMPAYNAEKYISEAISCILSQTYKNFELLIADDCSTDTTVEIISEFTDSRIKFYQNKENLGYLKTCNMLFSECKGDLITFQDADDISPKFRIEKQVNEFITDPEVELCTTNSFTMDENGKIIMARKWPIDFYKFKHDPDYNPVVCGATIMLTDHLLKKAGLYHEYFKRGGGEDFEWFFRCVFNSRKSVHINNELYSYRIHNSAVRIANNGPKYLQNVIDEMRVHFIKTGEYLLDEKHAEKLRAIEEEFENEFLNDPAMHIRVKANGAIAAKKYMEFLKFSWTSIKMEPTNLKNYSAFFTSIYNRMKGIAYGLINNA